MALTVGVFDSGIGGISVLEKAQGALPRTNFLYYADLSHVPYGKKTTEEIIQYVDEAVSFLRMQGADIIVLACNTATSAAAATLRAKYDFPILGMEPAVKVAARALGEEKAGRIIVTATELTLKLEKLDRLIHELGVYDQVDEVSLQELVAFAEQRTFAGSAVEDYLVQTFSMVDLAHASSIVLGCTHFTFYKTLIADIVQRLSGRKVSVIDGNLGTVNHLATLAKADHAQEKPSVARIRFFESGIEASFEKYADLLIQAHKENARGD